MRFIEVNVNPKNRKTGDCVIRAISNALNQTWDETYKDLVELGFKNKLMPNDPKCFNAYLKSKGHAKLPMPKKANGKRYTVKEFAELNKKGTWIISVAHHLTVIKNGNLYDSWDCGYKSCGNVWKIN